MSHNKQLQSCTRWQLCSEQDISKFNDVMQEEKTPEGSVSDNA
jgi:hypothetical protein